MNEEEQKGRLHKAGDGLVFWWRVTSAVIGVFGVLGLAWTQVLGPGIKSGFQDFVGVTEFREEVLIRLDSVEKFMPAPAVVVWDENEIYQAGACNSDGCVYALGGTRTSYGLSCGKVVSATPSIRIEGRRPIQINYDGFVPVTLGAEPVNFFVPLKIPKAIPDGDHEWRTQVVYENCPAAGEPIPRYTPWFPLKVGK